MGVAKTIRPYHQPAGGWGALKAMGTALARQNVPVSGMVTLARMNQPGGFDCPGCGWADPRHTSPFEYCENGGKAVAWEMTARRCTPDFFAAHTVTELSALSDYELEMEGRLTHPMRYDAGRDQYVPVSWDEAFAIVGEHLRALPNPNLAEFYTSGRASNEAAFLYQLFAREYGTNNFPDCSNMCHEATSVGLPQSIGVGKGTVLLEDFARADCIFIFGQNPGTNSPRMMTELRNASRRGATIMSFNPFRERALERFQAPQSPVEMVTLSSTPISSRIFQVKVGGDVALIKGIMKHLVAADENARQHAQAPVLDWDFIRGHTSGIDALIADLRVTSWADIERRSGIAAPTSPWRPMPIARPSGPSSSTAWASRSTATAPKTCSRSPISPCCAAMWGGRARASARCGPFQRAGRPHRRHYGDAEPGAAGGDRGALRLHPAQSLRAQCGDRAGSHGAGRDQGVYRPRRQFRGRDPDWQLTQQAMRRLDLTVHIATKLNRSHLVHGRTALILPASGGPRSTCRRAGRNR